MIQGSSNSQYKAFDNYLMSMNLLQGKQKELKDQENLPKGLNVSLDPRYHSH